MKKKISKEEEEKAIAERRVWLGLDKPVTALKNPDKEMRTITLTDAVEEYSQLCNGLEKEIDDFTKSLTPVLTNVPEKYAICDGKFNSSPTVSDIVNINKILQRAITTLYNLRINLGI